MGGRQYPGTERPKPVKRLSGAVRLLCEPGEPGEPGVPAAPHSHAGAGQREGRSCQASARAALLCKGEMPRRGLGGRYPGQRFNSGNGTRQSGLPLGLGGGMHCFFTSHLADAVRSLSWRAPAMVTGYLSTQKPSPQTTNSPDDYLSPLIALALCSPPHFASHLYRSCFDPRDSS